MKSPFAPPYATMQEKIDQMHLHCKSIDQENKLKDEWNHCRPLVDNDVLLSALNQRSALLEVLEELLYGTFPDGVDDDGSGRIGFSDACVKRYNKAKAAIAAARGE